MTGFKPGFSGISGDRSANCQHPLPYFKMFIKALVIDIYISRFQSTFLFDLFI